MVYAGSISGSLTFYLDGQLLYERRVQLNETSHPLVCGGKVCNPKTCYLDFTICFCLH